MIDQAFSLPDRPRKPPMEEGVYNVELIDVSVKEKDKFRETPDAPIEKELFFVFTYAVIDEGAHYGRKLFDDARPTLTVKPKASNLHIILQKLTGVSFSEEQCRDQKNVLTADFMNSLVGLQKQVSVVIKTSKLGNQSNPIDAYLPTKVSLPPFDETKIVATPAA